MKVWKTGVYEGATFDKNIYVAPIFLTKIGTYFLNRTYGEGVSEIYHREFCLKRGYDGKLYHYAKKKKMIDTAIVIDYENAIQISNEEFSRHLAQLYLERSKGFSELKIMDFDLNKYQNDLRTFFIENNLIKE